MSKSGQEFIRQSKILYHQGDPECPGHPDNADLYVKDLENLLKQIVTWYEEGVDGPHLYDLVAKGKDLLERTPPHSDLSTIDLDHDLGLRDLTAPFER